MNATKMLLIGVAVGIIGFFAGMMWMVFTAISGEIDLMPLLFGFAMIIICPLAGLFLGMMLNKPKIIPVSETSPLEEEEKKEISYCPICHANLGYDAPQKCPECGYMR